MYVRHLSDRSIKMYAKSLEIRTNRWIGGRLICASLVSVRRAYRPPQARRASTHVVLLKFKGDGGEPRTVGGGQREGSRDRGRAANVCSRHTIPYYCSRECQVARFALAARQLVHM